MRLPIEQVATIIAGGVAVLVLVALIKRQQGGAGSSDADVVIAACRG